MQSLELISKKIIPASPERVFRMWTDPEKFKLWWGPQGVSCSKVQLELKVGGSYSIENLFANGDKLIIFGVYEQIVPNKKLIYTWNIADGKAERVTVLFAEHLQGTELTVIHQRIGDVKSQQRHTLGWQGCLDKLCAYAA
ncbi:MAG: SRPBCC domain-containing protein [Pseudomonadales bacterium]|nr:SRPBCC domain-containing protein [Pseudomonadales bacterium]